MSSAAKDEYDVLVAAHDRPSCHPEDLTSSSEKDGDSDTLAASTHTRDSDLYRTSIRSGKNDDRNSSDADSDVEDPSPRSRPFYLPKHYAADANTGPKGVIADAQAFEQEKVAGNKNTYVRTQDLTLPKMQRLASLDPPPTADRSDTDEDGTMELEKDDGNNYRGDDDFMRNWRAMRIAELRKGRLNGASLGSKAKRGKYGTMKTVDALEFLDTVDSVSNGTVVIVYVFEDKAPISEAFHSHLTTLASKYSHIRFIALDHEDAEIEPAGVPALLAYRNGVQFAAMIPLRDEVSLASDVETNLEEAFRAHRIL